MWWDKRPEWLDELGAKLESMREDSKRYNEESKRREEESKRREEESKKRREELDAKLASMAEESKRRDEQLRVRVAEMTANVCGISDSNGMYAEELFFFSLLEKKEFAGIHFDDVDNNVGCIQKQFGGKRLQNQFDIVMKNNVAIAIIEAKYRARKTDVDKLVQVKAESFKTLFPEYKDFKIYLGLAALTFESQAVEEARKYGVGLLKQVGDTVEYAADWEVKAY
jgi:ATPase subunit of ABC transporter with duplicated ATPase domains